MAERVGQVVIAGGGSSGWMAAAYLRRALGPDTVITVVEAPEVPTVGVGEATIPTLGHTLRFIGLEESQWMPRCQATYKLAIRFVDWLRGNDAYWHPFLARPARVLTPSGSPYFPALVPGLSRAQCWLNEHLEGRGGAYAAHVPNTALCEAMKAPIEPMASGARMNGAGRRPQPRAYHLDATKLAHILKEHAMAAGVRHQQGFIAEVCCERPGWVRALKLADGREISGDLFIDCTGFRSLLLSEALKEPFLSDAAHLLCDRAVAIRAHHDGAMGPGRLRPYTQATALSSGWVWDIPLFERSGSGYVYASRFLAPEDAELALRAYLGPRAEGLSAKHLSMRIGRMARAWVGNTVAIGLSAGFLEPLESTGIFLTEYQLGLLAALWPGKGMAQARQDRYNEAFAARYEELRDFIVLHYILSQRDDSPFWRAARSVEVPDSLRSRLDVIATGFPELDALQPPVFRASSWAAVMAGMEAMPQMPHPLVAQVALAERQGFLAELRAEGQALAGRMPDHWEYIAAMQGVSS